MFFFFFQAEDGIRDLVRSRGLGDVYKRQVQFPEFHIAGELRNFYFGQYGTNAFGKAEHDFISVSYTHLTLPTSDLV